MVMVQSEQFKKGPWLFKEFVGDEILPSYMRIYEDYVINHCKDPY